MARTEQQILRDFKALTRRRSRDRRDKKREQIKRVEGDANYTKRARNCKSNGDAHSEDDSIDDIDDKGNARVIPKTVEELTQQDLKDIERFRKQRDVSNRRLKEKRLRNAQSHSGKSKAGKSTAVSVEAAEFTIPRTQRALSFKGDTAQNAPTAAVSDPAPEPKQAIDFITVRGNHYRNELFIVPDNAEKRIPPKNPSEATAFRNGKEPDTCYLNTTDINIRRGEVIAEHTSNLNGSNKKGIAKGKTYTPNCCEGEITYHLKGCSNSGVNRKNILILDPADANFKIELKNRVQKNWPILRGEYFHCF